MAGIKSVFFWRAVLAEFLGSTIFTCTAISVTLNFDVNNVMAQLKIALCLGFTLASISYMFLPISGGVLNPAVTIGLFVGRRFSFLKTLFYVLVQTCGAITGSAVIYALTPGKRRGVLGNLSLFNDTTMWQGFGLEGIIGFMLVTVYMAGTDPNRKESGFGPGLAYGVATIALHLVAVPYTGCGLNPARALGPAVVMNQWPHYHWIYWAGPILGGIIAGILYELIFSAFDEDEENRKASLDLQHDYIVETLPQDGSHSNYTKRGTYKYGSKADVYSNSNI